MDGSLHLFVMRLYCSHLNQAGVLIDWCTIKWVMCGIIHTKYWKHVSGVLLRMISLPIEHFCSPYLQENITVVGDTFSVVNRH